MAIWVFMGGGKSVSTLTALSDLIDACAIRKVLIIAPLRVAQNVWAQEAKQWEHLKHLKFSLCTGTDDERRKAFNRKADIYLINRENIQWVVKQCKKVWPFDAIVIDETVKVCRDPSGSRFKALKRTIPATNFMIELTGTPGNLETLWPQIFLLDKGKSLSKFITHYRKRYFNKGEYDYKYTPKEGAAEEIYAKIDHLILSMEGKDYITLPKKIDITEKVWLDENLMDKYRDFKKKLLLEIKGGVIEAANAAVLSGKLQQFTSGFVYDENRNWHLIHDRKLDVLEELVEENEDEQMIVAYYFKPDLIRLKERFPHGRVLKGKSEIDDWNAGKINMLFLHPGSDSSGLNLQYNTKGSTFVWFTRTWNLEEDTQSIGRIYRQGQTRPVRVVTLTCSGTVDESINSAMMSKKATEDHMIKALKKEFKGVG